MSDQIATVEHHCDNHAEIHDENYDSDWNAIWEAEVHIDELGWSIEMEIPFSNLSFYEGDKLIWGINFTRFIQRKYETVTWVAFPLDVVGVVSKYGHLHGLNGIYPPAKFEFRPYSMAGVTNYNDILLKSLSTLLLLCLCLLNLIHI